MASKGPLKKIFNPAHRGMLHRALGVPEGQPIPRAKLAKALRSKNSHIRHMAEAAHIGIQITHGK